MVTAPPFMQISASRIPSRAANSIQTLKMAEALKSLFGPTCLAACVGSEKDVDLSDRSETMAFYGVSDLPEFRLIKNEGRFGVHKFNFLAGIYAKRRRAPLVLSRSIGAASLCARLGLSTVWECHAPPQGFEKIYLRWLVKSKNFRRLVVISHGLQNEINERHSELRNIDTIIAGDGVDLARFKHLPDARTAKLSVGVEPRRPVAGYSGHLYEGRGLDILVQCARALPNWDFVIAGGTNDTIRELRRKLAAESINNIDLWGFVPNGELAVRLAIADVLLMPYQKSVMVSGGTLDTARWMSPLKMFEYMAMGRAIISSDLPALREVLDDKTARLVAPENTRSWIEALKSLESDAQRRDIAKNARAAAQQYGWDKRAARMVADLMPTGR